MKREDKDKVLAEICFCKLNPSDLEQVATLISGMNKDSPDTFYLRSQTREYYDWMYFKNPAGDAIAYCAKHYDKIVGSFAMVPKKFYVNGENKIVGKTMDMFTDPNYQGLGLMSVLTKKVFSESKNNGIYFWYVTPSDDSYPIFKNKWGYKESIEIFYYMKILKYGEVINTFANKNRNVLIEKVLSIFNLLNYRTKELDLNHDVWKIDIFDDKVDKLWGKVQLDLNIAMVRNSTYLNWRYIDNPDRYDTFGFHSNGDLVGIIVLKETLRRGLRTGEIVDYIYMSKDMKLFNEMIAFAINYFQKIGCSICHTWVINDEEEITLFKNAGIKIRRKQVRYLLCPNAEYRGVYNRKNWLITQGDGNDI